MKLFDSPLNYSLKSNFINILQLISLYLRQFKPVIIKPESGLTVTFPSYIYHTAAPFTGIVREAYVTEIQLMSETWGKAELGVSSI